MSEHNIIMLKKTKRVMWALCVVVVVLSVLYFTGILQKFASSQNLGDLSYLSQSAGTGLVAPVTREVALVENSERYATNTPQGKNLASQNAAGKSVAMGNSPVVLFDISTNPAFGKTYNLLTWIWIGSGIISLIILIFLLRGYIKNRRFQKIKENT